MTDVAGFTEILPPGVVRLDSLEAGDHCVPVDRIVCMTILRYSHEFMVAPTGPGTPVPARYGDGCAVMLLPARLPVRPCDADGTLLPVEKEKFLGGPSQCPNCGKLCVQDFPPDQPAMAGLRWFWWRCFGCDWRGERRDEHFHVPTPDEVLRKEWEKLNGEESAS